MSDPQETVSEPTSAAEPAAAPEPEETAYEAELKAVNEAAKQPVGEAKEQEGQDG